jgi:hypothetical protein
VVAGEFAVGVTPLDTEIPEAVKREIPEVEVVVTVI